MANEETGVSIAGRHVAGAKILFLGLLLGLTQGAAILSLYIIASPANHYAPGFRGILAPLPYSYDQDILLPFLAVILLFRGLGAYWWGRVIDGESSLAPRLLALTQGAAALFSLLWPWLLSLSAWLTPLVSSWTGAKGHGLLLFVEQALVLLPLLALPAFFSGAAAPLLMEMALKKRRLLEWNLPLVGAARLLGLSGGFALALFAPFEQKMILWGALAASVLLALITPLWGERPDEDEYEGAFGGGRLWPSHSLGLWSGEAINVLDHDLTRTAARPAWLVTFLSCFTICGCLGAVWLSKTYSPYISPTYDLNLWWIYVPAVMALGGLIVAPQLSRCGSPSTALALAAFLAAGGFPFALWLLDTLAPPQAMYGDGSIFAQREFTAFLWPAAILGIIWPLAGHVFHSRRHWLASSLGLTSFWSALGAVMGLIMSRSGLLEPLAQLIACFVVALLAAFLAITPLVGFFMAVLLWLAALLVLYILFGVIL